MVMRRLAVGDLLDRAPRMPRSFALAGQEIVLALVSMSLNMRRFGHDRQMVHSQKVQREYRWLGRGLVKRQDLVTIKARAV
jgi:hypothetical protein